MAAARRELGELLQPVAILRSVPRAPANALLALYHGLPLPINALLIDARLRFGPLRKLQYCAGPVGLRACTFNYSCALKERCLAN